MFFPLLVLHRQYSIAKHFKNWNYNCVSALMSVQGTPLQFKVSCEDLPQPILILSFSMYSNSFIYVATKLGRKKSIFAKLFCDPEHIILIDHSLTMEQLSSIFLCKAPPLTHNSVHLGFFSHYISQHLFVLSGVFSD